MPSPNPATVPSAARYQPGARRRRVRVIAAPSEGTPSRCLLTLSGPATGTAATARRGLLALLVEPAVELALGDHAHALAHRGVADPAKLGAHDLVAADPVRRQADLGGQARHGVRLEPELRDPERVDDVPGPDPEVDRAVL